MSVCRCSFWSYSQRNRELPGSKGPEEKEDRLMRIRPLILTLLFLSLLPSLGCWPVVTTRIAASPLHAATRTCRPRRCRSPPAAAQDNGLAALMHSPTLAHPVRAGSHRRGLPVGNNPFNQRTFAGRLRLRKPHQLALSAIFRFFIWGE